MSSQPDPSLVRQQYDEQCRDRGYLFTREWFCTNLSLWQKILGPARDKPNIHFLEIGSWEGQSTCWLLDNVLTHPESTITCIDTFAGSVEHGSATFDLQTLEARFDQNIALTGAGDRVKKVVGLSQVELRKLPIDHFHLVYIDGSHIAADVLEDAVLTWRLLRKNGMLVFDDYEWPVYRDKPHLHPKPAIDAFLSVFGDRLKVVHKGYQVIAQKKAD